MKLTPQEILTQQFGVKVKGFDKEEVKNFLVQIAEVLENEIVDFWLNAKALGHLETALQRTSQVVFIVRDNKGQISAVSTAYEQRNPRLNNHYFYYMRVFPLAVLLHIPYVVIFGLLGQILKFNWKNTLFTKKG